MKRTFLFTLLCLTPMLVAAQECPQRPVEQLPAAQAAPTPGHPLDPNDVAILTGHAPGANAHSAYPASTVMYGYTAPYSFGYGQRFGFNGFFFPGSGRFGGRPFFGAPFGPFFFSGFPGGWR